VSILDEILAHKREELEAELRERPAAELAERALRTPPTRGFRRALCEAPEPRVIAEVKRRSPSRGEIRPDLDPVACAKAYAEAGAAAISVLTDERFFGGHLDHLGAVRAAVDVPLLRKDFVIDAYQIDQARVAGADAVLLIVAALEPALLAELHTHAQGLGLDALVEVHDEAELERALVAGADLLGINNRDLRSFRVELATSERLAPLVPEGVVWVAESGIHTSADLERLRAAGAQAVLVGESLMRAPDVGAALRTLRGKS
jgi:indole-3-glycerol phosphate synthase